MPSEIFHNINITIFTYIMLEIMNGIIRTESTTHNILQLCACVYITMVLHVIDTNSMVAFHTHGRCIVFGQNQIDVHVAANSNAISLLHPPKVHI
jgi:hypothetical protein